MAVRLIPAQTVRICDICKVEQPTPEATAPFGLFTLLGKVMLIRYEIKGTVEVALPLDVCNECYNSVAGYLDALIAVRRQRQAEEAQDVPLQGTDL